MTSAPRRSAELERAGLVDDGRLAAGRAAALSSRGLGDAAIAWRLEQAGVAPDRVSAAIAALEPEPDRARRLAARFREGAGAAFLARRGFSEDAIEAAVGVDGRGAID